MSYGLERLKEYLDAVICALPFRLLLTLHMDKEGNTALREIEGEISRLGIRGLALLPTRDPH